jgi:uroporphyrinogen decarboxylase
MNDYFYPMPGNLLELKTPRDLAEIKPFEPEETDWAEQLKAIEIISREVVGKTYFIDTVFDPWQVLLRNLAGEHLDELVDSAPDAILRSLDVITDNIIAYCRKAFSAGCNGIFLSTFGSKKQMERERYLRFALPFVRRILEAVESLGPMNTLHVHDYGIFVDDIVGLPVPILSYEDRHDSNPSMNEIRSKWGGTIMAGMDKNKVTRVTPAEAARNAIDGIRMGGPTKFMLAPGCSFPTWLYPKAASAIVDAVKSWSSGR